MAGINFRFTKDKRYFARYLHNSSLTCYFVQNNKRKLQARIIIVNTYNINNVLINIAEVILNLCIVLRFSELLTIQKIYTIVALTVIGRSKHIHYTHNAFYKTLNDSCITV